eukprot:2906030-Prymnesium_polylepis.1
MGVFWGSWAARDPGGSAANVELLARWHAEGKLRPVCSQTFELADTAKALLTLEQRRATGKVCVVVEQRRSKL